LSAARASRSTNRLVRWLTVERDEWSGRRIGKYRVLRRLSQGGMAELLLAQSAGTQGFSKLVVVKRILPRFAEEPEFIRMFLDEARLAATLSHPNVVSVFDIGREDTDYFFTMEYIHGVDLRALLEAARRSGERLPFDHAIWIGIGIAAGLHHAHERIGADGTPLAIVHRDVSPSNVLVTWEGVVKLVDFGIAKATQRDHDSSIGTRKGKLPYMSPEQCRGQALDRRSDVYSLGAVLYELTTMRRLHSGDDQVELIAGIVHRDAPPPSFRHAEYPPELERIVLRALARDPVARYSTAQELQLELEQFARDARLACSAGSLARYLERVLQVQPHPYETIGVADLDPTRSDRDGPTRVVVPAPSETVKARRWPLALGLAAGSAVIAAAVVATLVSRSSASEPVPSAASPVEPPVEAATLASPEPAAIAPTKVEIPVPIPSPTAPAEVAAPPSGETPVAAPATKRTRASGRRSRESPERSATEPAEASEELFPF
jgi:serine/threonine protein kinase